MKIRFAIFHVFAIAIALKPVRFQDDERVIRPLAGASFHEFSDGVTGLDPPLFGWNRGWDEDEEFF